MNVPANPEVAKLQNALELMRGKLSELPKDQELYKRQWEIANDKEFIGMMSKSIESGKDCKTAIENTVAMYQKTLAHVKEKRLRDMAVDLGTFGKSLVSALEMV
jgi:phosphoenolpyruvate-protein kinase (PTS system EI component)